MKINADMLEGIVVTAIGSVILISSILLPENPIRFEGWLGVVVQAGFIPTILSLLIIIFGFKLILSNRIPAIDKPVITEKADRVPVGRIAAIVGFTTAYVVLLGIINFSLLSLFYFIIIICYLKFTENGRKSNWVPIFMKTVLISVMFVLIVAYLLPYMLRLQVP
jgi:hypothetical protein